MKLFLCLGICQLSPFTTQFFAFTFLNWNLCKYSVFEKHFLHTFSLYFGYYHGPPLDTIGDITFLYPIDILHNRIVHSFPCRTCSPILFRECMVYHFLSQLSIYYFFIFISQFSNSAKYSKIRNRIHCHFHTLRVSCASITSLIYWGFLGFGSGEKDKTARYGIMRL